VLEEPVADQPVGKEIAERVPMQWARLGSEAT
jgi:hypothetical protein